MQSRTAPRKGEQLTLRSTPPSDRHAAAAAHYADWPARRTDTTDETAALELIDRLGTARCWDLFLAWHSSQQRLATIRKPQARRAYQAADKASKVAIERSWGFTNRNGKLAGAVWRLGLGIETVAVSPTQRYLEEAEADVKAAQADVDRLLSILRQFDIQVERDPDTGRYQAMPRQERLFAA